MHFIPIVGFEIQNIQIFQAGNMDEFDEEGDDLLSSFIEEREGLF